MINALIIVNELRYACGVTNHVLHLAKGLADSGEVKVFIICGGGNGIERFNEIDAEIIYDKRFLHKGRDIRNYFIAITALARYIRKYKINIIHSHTHYAANIASRASKLMKIPAIQTNHGLLQFKGRLKHFNAEKYIAINEHIKDYMIKQKIANEGDIKFIRCGIPIISPEPPKAKGKIKVLSASRFNYEKGLDLYIKAAASLDEATKQKCEFFLAGEGEIESTLKDLNEKLNSNVKFCGSVKDMYKLLAETHIFVYPSRSKSEGFPAVLTEAGATNNLVISSDFDGVSPVIENNKQGLIFKSNDVDDLKLKLTEAVHHYENYTNLSLNFYNKVKTLYDINTMIEKHINLYKECLKK